MRTVAYRRTIRAVREDNLHRTPRIGELLRVGLPRAARIAYIQTRAVTRFLRPAKHATVREDRRGIIRSGRRRDRAGLSRANRQDAELVVRGPGQDALAVRRKADGEAFPEADRIAAGSVAHVHQRMIARSFARLGKQN